MKEQNEVVLSETHDNSTKNLAHIGEYAILAFLIFRVLYNREEKGFSWEIFLWME
ncbi:VanZ family protein [Candidatus Aerophobetes bacterium]|nr:VanZ family protein [Candidatus Aerophobetes bacterium]